ETFLSGPAIARDHLATADESLSLPEITARAELGDAACDATLQRFEDRLARSLASVVNVLDPDVIVMGGGVSNLARLYPRVPRLLSRYVFSDVVDVPILPALHGDSGGVRGAAWLWPNDAA